MTEWLKEADLDNLKPGDKVVITAIVATEPGPDSHTVMVSSPTRNGETEPDSRAIIARELEITATRPIDMPDKPGAVVFPHNRMTGVPYVLNEHGNAWSSTYRPHRTNDVIEALAAGTHFIAFEGVDL